jgi:hypothetical protein
MISLHLVFLLLFNLSSTGEYFGEHKSSYNDNLEKIRKLSKKKGLEDALEKVWKTISPGLLKNIKVLKRKKIKRYVLRNKSSYLIGMSEIQEKILPQNIFYWKAKYKLDITKVVFHIKKLIFSIQRKKTILIYRTKNIKIPYSDYKPLFPARMFRLKFSKRKFPKKRCKKDFCLQLDIQKKEKEFILNYKLLKKGKRQKPLTFFVKTQEKSELFLKLPSVIEKKLKIVNSDLKLVFKNQISPDKYIKILYLLQKQEPHILSLKSFGLLNGKQWVTFNSRNHKNRSLFNGLYFGDNVKYKVTLEKNGDYSMEIIEKKESLESK